MFQAAYAQEKIEDAPKLFEDSIALYKDRLKFTPFIAPSYSPELEFLLSAGGLITFKADPRDPLLQRSSIPFSVGYSSNGAKTVSVRPVFFGKGDKVRVIGEYWLQDMPDHYWGVGAQNGLSRDKGPETGYRKFWEELNGKVVYLLKSTTYFGWAFDFAHTRATEMNSNMEQDSYILSQGSEIYNNGVGVVFQTDSRDISVNAYKGTFVDISFLWHNRLNNKGFRHEQLTADFRTYLPLFKEGRRLALQAKGTLTSNSVPWSDMPYVGSMFDLRGYFKARFRDNNAVLAIAEYRHQFQRRTPAKDGRTNSRHGFSAWIGTGSVGPDLAHFDVWLHNAGVGYRFEVQPRMNVRVDYGVGIGNNSAIYFTFNEAF